ncbi:TPA: DUF1292 domain-containing protein [Candidatus Avacholeplasma faecigallinarum]|nr:DUF1292 domain-containing protein [Candidatus Avacholeplasma faecigallinarum]
MKKNEIEKLLDENDNSNLVFYNDNKEKIEFEQVALINIDNENYAILHPVNLGYQDDEVIAYSIKIDNLNYELLEVEDDDLLDKIYNEYQKFYKSKK